jgi:hypothetical protein
MVKKRSLLIILISLILIGIVVFYPTEKRKIKRVLKRGCEWVEKRGDENPLVFAVKSKNGEKIFSKSVFLKYNKYVKRDVSIEEIERGYISLMQSVKSLNVKITDFNIEIVDDISASCDATVLIDTSGEIYSDLKNVSEVLFTFKKEDKGWRISGIEVVEVLEK